MNFLHNILLTAFDYTNIPLTVLTEINELIYTTSASVTKHTIKELSLVENENSILFAYTPDNLIYATFIFSYEDINYYLLIGPYYLFSAKDGAQIRSVDPHLQIKKAVVFFENWSEFLYKLLTERKHLPVYKHYSDTFMAENIVFDDLEPIASKSSGVVDLDFLLLQRQIFQFILTGDDTNALQVLEQYIAISRLNFSENHIQKIKYHIVIFIALLSNLLIMEKNINVATISNMSEMYITEIDGLKTPDELYNFFKAVVVEFSHKVEQLNYYSPHVTKAIQYITNQLYNPISVQDIAKHLGLSLSYTSNLFKREVGLSLKKFIQVKRIEEAKMLLMYSDYSTTQIAQHLQFCSPSYFSKVFTQQIGLTPRQFYKTNMAKHKIS